MSGEGARTLAADLFEGASPRFLAGLAELDAIVGGAGAVLGTIFVPSPNPGLTSECAVPGDPNLRYTINRDQNTLRLIRKDSTGAELAAVASKGLRGTSRLALDCHKARVVSLLAAAHGEPVAESGVEKIRRAGEFWCAGEKALAQIHLIFIGLPKINEVGAYRLFFATVALEKGLDPSDSRFRSRVFSSALSPPLYLADLGHPFRKAVSCHLIPRHA